MQNDGRAVMGWRDRLARVEQYAEVGQYRVRALRDALVSGMALKYLFWEGMPWWGAVLLSGPVFIGYFAMGWAYNRWGWLKQSSTVSLREEMSRPSIVSFEWMARLLQHQGVPLNNIPSKLRPEIVEVMDVPNT